MTPAEREACGRLAEELAEDAELHVTYASESYALILAALREAAAPREPVSEEAIRQLLTEWANIQGFSKRYPTLAVFLAAKLNQKEEK